MSRTVSKLLILGALLLVMLQANSSPSQQSTVLPLKQIAQAKSETVSGGPAKQVLLTNRSWWMAVKGNLGQYGQTLTVNKLPHGDVKITIVGGFLFVPQTVKDLKFSGSSFSFSWRDTSSSRDIRVTATLQGKQTFNVTVSGPGRRGGYFTEHGTLSPEE